MPKGGAKKGKGIVVTWLREHASHTGKNCLRYPFPYSKRTGYPQFGYNGKVVYAHRFMCELVNGAPPTPKHEAAHTCGNAHMLYINPNHLKWKTKIENAQDRKRHGNYQDQIGTKRWRLTPEQVETIKARAYQEIDLTSQIGNAMTITIVRYKLAQAAAAIVILWPLFRLFHLIEGKPAPISEFEAGGITAVVILRLIEALHAWGRP